MIASLTFDLFFTGGHHLLPAAARAGVLFIFIPSSFSVLTSFLPLSLYSSFLPLSAGGHHLLPAAARAGVRAPKNAPLRPSSKCHGRGQVPPPGLEPSSFYTAVRLSNLLEFTRQSGDCFLAVYSQVDILVGWYTSVNFGPSATPENAPLRSSSERHGRCQVPLPGLLSADCRVRSGRFESPFYKAVT